MRRSRRKPVPPWSDAQFDRVFTDASGIRHILDGSQGHGGGGLGWHPGARSGCPMCAEQGHAGDGHWCYDTCVSYRFPQQR